MIIVTLPNNHYAERKYTVDVLLDEWLGLPIEVQYNEMAFSADLALENGNRILFEDHFFNHFQKEGAYLDAANIPTAIHWTSKTVNPFLSEEDLPVIFGYERLHISSNKISCGIDIFAATFFMLTRWEEYVLPDRDSHGRFPAQASLAGKFKFLHRPVVNEMVEMLWAMLVHLGISHSRKKQKFEVLLTHDVDLPLLWSSPFAFWKKLGGDLLKRADFREAAFSIKSYTRTRFFGENDPYDTFDFLMDCAERHGLKSQFFFLCGGDTHFDEGRMPLEAPFMRNLIGKIQARGHGIGIHPSYNSLKDNPLLQLEKKSLEQATGFPVKSGRQHFLRFEAPSTWQMLEDNGIEWESTLCFSEQPGFRCGTCLPFPVFNFLTRQQLKLMEFPLTAMEVSWATYLKSSPEKMLEEIIKLSQVARKYKGNFVLLWHNSSFNVPSWLPYSAVYELLLNELKV